ncbi:endospore germination permease [Virgibacillus sp. C22-A2]|uniref:Endospore germination permease n=1 Tax=Virgibacillus tibetensis TaxID=3042313 RepID=A0ABU6KEF5_9BACI|nr:endospore germination permease [Virgibacillus sp. C22-A2]
MVEKGKISALQMAFLLYPTITATAILLVPAITGKYAKQDLWLSPIWASFAGVLVVFLVIQLNKRFPEQTIIQYGEKITGKFFGKLLGAALIFFLFHSNGMIIREYGEFIVGSFLPDTPMVVIIGSILFVCALAVRGGVEVLARSAEIIIPVVALVFISTLLLLLAETDVTNILSVFEKGITPSLMGAVVPSGWFMQFFMLSFFLPFLKDRKKGMKVSMFTLAAVMFTLVITNLVTVMVLGKLTETFTYPVMEAVRQINLADFIQNFESIVMALWVATTFIKITVFYYAIVLGTAQLLKLSDYRPIVFPIGFLLGGMSIWSATSLQELSYILSHIFPFYGPIFYVLIPVLLFLLAVFRKKTSNKSA